jgi:hypothetical protein
MQASPNQLIRPHTVSLGGCSGSFSAPPDSDCGLPQERNVAARVRSRPRGGIR